MSFDPATLFTISVIALVSMGSLLITLSFQERETIALRWWGAFFLLGAVFMMLLLVSPSHTNAPAREVATAIALFAYGLLFAACRTFNRRSVLRGTTVLVPVVWLMFCLTIRPSATVCSAVAAILIASYCVASSVELRLGNRDNLKLQKWAAWLLAVQGLFYLSRLVAGPIGMPHVRWMETAASPWGALLGSETIAFIFFFGFLTIAMTRERVVHHLRKASLEDALTGIGNRRALLEQGQPLLDSSIFGGRTVALVLFDLDHFKAVNDTHGHEGGDRLLVQFAALAVESLPLGSLFCRIGGEEFAALLPNAGASEARALAEIIRMRFERCAIPGRGALIATTVSAGIALTTSNRSLDLLLAQADVHLYFAKAQGRNRVADGACNLAQDVQPTSLVA